MKYIPYINYVLGFLLLILLLLFGVSANGTTCTTTEGIGGVVYTDCDDGTNCTSTETIGGTIETTCD